MKENKAKFNGVILTMHDASLTSTLYDMNAAQAHTSAPRFYQHLSLHFCVTIHQIKHKKKYNPKLQLVDAKLKFFAKWLQSENEALFEQIYIILYIFSFSKH